MIECNARIVSSFRVACRMQRICYRIAAVALAVVYLLDGAVVQLAHRHGASCCTGASCPAPGNRSTDAAPDHANHAHAGHSHAGHSHVGHDHSGHNHSAHGDAGQTASTAPPCPGDGPAPCDDSCVACRYAALAWIRVVPFTLPPRVDPVEPLQVADIVAVDGDRLDRPRCRAPPADCRS
ncbi:hypothetical protein [Lignipirellula cremea]|uniref:Uncharacterized protein n=1 Tax=Lignipirellula cremea TaxID=2528010 RepID=A0A518E1U9_9BACT|nr:hypothetical protein [Lignipirellula cremea]QDU98066.1 hypothetical protein Pla8534_59270 [Lignipirellula cremea]